MNDIFFRVGISLQEFFPLEISLQDFFPEITHTPPPPPSKVKWSAPKLNLPLFLFYFFTSWGVPCSGT